MSDPQQRHDYWMALYKNAAEVERERRDREATYEIICQVMSRHPIANDKSS